MNSNEFDGYIIYCSTGCTCCSRDNHWRGIYKTQADADNRVLWFLAGDNEPPVASRYAERGRYHVKRVKVERLWDGRFIIGNRVFSNVNIVEWAGKEGNKSFIPEQSSDYLCSDESTFDSEL